MNLKGDIKLFVNYIIILIFVAFGVVTVFSTDLIFDAQIDKKELLSKNIFLDDSKLNSKYIIFESNGDLSKYKLSSVCQNYSKFIWSKDNKFIFKINILDQNCKNWTLFLENLEKVKLKKSFIKINLFNRSKLFDLYIDNDDSNLENINSKINLTIKNIENKLKTTKIKDFEYLKQKRKLEELKYHKNLLKNILENRNKKYLKPLLWYKISKEKNKIPNAWRPYRSSYTDWIHHGWDMVAPNETNSYSLDYGKIVKIVRDFKYSNLNNLKKWNNISYIDKVKNLDILRGNQVWLKTSKWDIVLYSHLTDVSNNIKVWDIVNRKTFLWTTWISWVPDRNYKNYHLHFSIMKNPYIKNKIWKYSLIDYLKWDWYFKWKSLDYVSENSFKLFK